MKAKMIEKYKIEKGVAVPPRNQPIERFPLKDLDQGESFKFDLKEYKSLERAKIAYQKRNAGVRFHIRRNMEKKGEGRIWRIA